MNLKNFWINRHLHLETRFMTRYTKLHMVSFARLFSYLVFLLLGLTTAALSEVLPPPVDHPVQDEANILSPTVRDNLANLIAKDGREIRLVIVPDRREYGAVGPFSQYVDALAESHGINQHRLAILVVEDIRSKNIAIRLGRGYTDQYRRQARRIISQIYQNYLQQQLYNAGYSTGIAALIEQLPKVEYPSQSKPSAPIALQDNGALVQDHVGTIIPDEVDAFVAKLAAGLQKEQMLRLLIIQRYQDLNDDKFLAAFTNNIFDQWGMEDLHNAVLVLYEAQSNTVMLRLGYGFTPTQKALAFERLNTKYKHLLRQHKFNQAHQEGMLALLDVLGKPLKPVPALPLQAPLEKPPLPQSTQGADLLVSPYNTGALVQDSAGVLTPAAVSQLNRLIQGFKPAPLRILTVKNYSYRTNSRDFQTYANTLFSSWQLSSAPNTILPNTILIVHDVKYNRIAVAFGAQYTVAEQTRLRAILKTAYAPGLRQGLLNAAHITGIKALLKGFDAPSAAPPTVQPPVKPDDRKPAVSTPPTIPPTRQPLPLNMQLVLMAFLAILASIALAMYVSYRRSTAPRRARASRISAWKRKHKTQK